MSRVTVFQSNINAFLDRNALAFGGSTVRGIGRRADRVGDRMVTEARKNAREMFKKRTGALEASVVKIHRVGPRGGIVVGVGTTVEHGEHLEKGTRPHTIARAHAGYVLRSGGPRDRPPGYQNPRPLYGAKKVKHRGNKAYGWLQKAVNTVRARGV